MPRPLHLRRDQLRLHRRAAPACATTNIAIATSDVKNLCACYLPAEKYVEYARSLVATAPNAALAKQLAAATSSYPYCSYPQCVTSTYQMRNRATCPSTQLCLQVLTNNGGTITVNGDLQLSQQCKSTADELNTAPTSPSTPTAFSLEALRMLVAANPGVTVAAAGVLLALLILLLVRRRPRPPAQW